VAVGITVKPEYMFAMNGVQGVNITQRLGVIGVMAHLKAQRALSPCEWPA